MLGPTLDIEVFESLKQILEIVEVVQEKSSKFTPVQFLGVMGHFVVDATLQISLYFSTLGIDSYYSSFLKIIYLIAKFVFLLLFLYRIFLKSTLFIY